MKDSIYVVFTKAGGVERIYKKQRPELKRNEHACRLTLEVDDSYFRSAIPEVTMRLGPEDVIEPAVGVVVQEREGEDGQRETVVRDPQDALEQMVSDVLRGEELVGLPEWAYHAVVAKLRETEAVKRGWVELQHGLEERETEDGGRRAVRVVRGVRE